MKSKDSKPRKTRNFFDASREIMGDEKVDQAIEEGKINSISIRFSKELKSMRIKKGISQRDAAKIMGFKSLSQWQRLENNGNPTILMLLKIMKKFPEFKFKI